MTRTYKDRHDISVPHPPGIWRNGQDNREADAEIYTDGVDRLLAGFYVADASPAEPLDQLAQHVRNVLERGV